MKTIAHSICVLFLPLRTTTATLLSFCVFVVVCVYLTIFARARDA